MAKLLKLRRGSTSQHSSFTGAEGEVTVDTDKDSLVVHDGSTAGGHPVAAEDMANVSSASIIGRLGTGSIATAKLADSLITTAKIADDAVTSAKIADSTIAAGNIASNAITTAKIADDAVTGAKIAAEIDNSHITSSANIAGSKLADGGISTAKLAADCVTSAKIADDQINSEHYVNGSIDHDHLANDCVDGTNIQDDSINSEHYVNGSIDHDHLANDCVDGTNIQNDAINSEHYVDGSVDHQHLANDCIDSDNLQNDCVNSEHYVADSIDSEHYAPDSVDDTALSHTGVSAASYGSGSAIPVITVNAQGRITSASTASTSSDLVADTSPQLGGHLDTNGHNVSFSTGEKATWAASSGSGPEVTNTGSSNRDLQINIDNDHKYTLHQNGILYQEGANSSNGGAYTSPQPSYPIRAWLSFNDEDNITNGNGGISSVSDTGTGTFTINFSTSFPDDNYVMVGTSGGAGGSRGDDTCITHGVQNPGTGSLGIRCRKFTDNNFTNSESAMFLFLR